MVGDALGLVFISTIFPIIPAAVLAAGYLYGSSGAWCMAWLLYVGYPAVLGVAMWLDWSRSPASKVVEEAGKEAVR